MQLELGCPPRGGLSRCLGPRGHAVQYGSSLMLGGVMVRIRKLVLSIWFLDLFVLLLFPP